MFGFLNPRPHTADYRRAYARLCQHQRRNYGLWSLPFHSYEAVFLYQFALDADVFPTATMPHVRCCRLACPTSLTTAPDALVGRFCASVALLLGSIKLEDDIQDQRGLLARMARWVLRRRIQKSQAYFTTLDPRFASNVRQLLADHQRLEDPTRPIALANYTEPTRLAFGYVFGLMAYLPKLEAHRTMLQRLGQHLGTAIIAYDCAVDWKRDRRRGEFNSLPDEAAVHDAITTAAAELAEAEALIVQQYGASARSANTLRLVRQRVLHTDPLADAVSCPVHSRTLVQQVRQAASFVVVPMLAGRSHSDNDPRDRSYNGGDDPIGADKLPGGIENDVTPKKGKGSNSNNCCDGCDCCICIGPSCECGGAGGEGCCAGAECCACGA